MKKEIFPEYEVKTDKLSLAERLALFFAPTHKKIVIDTDEDIRQVYTLKYKILNSMVYLTGFREGVA